MFSNAAEGFCSSNSTSFRSVQGWSARFSAYLFLAVCGCGELLQLNQRNKKLRLTKQKVLVSLQASQPFNR